MAALPDLHNAVSFCQTENVRALLADGVDPNAFDRKGRTALAYLPSTAEPEALRELLQVLLDGGANPHCCDKLGNTALFYALDRGARTDQDSLLVACTTLLDAGVSIHQVGIDAQLPANMPHREVRPLDLALVKQCTKVVRLLLAQGASPLAEPTPTFGWTALHFAAVHPEFAEQFTRMGANPLALSVEGDTPLSLMGDAVKEQVQRAMVERERDVLKAIPTEVDSPLVGDPAPRGRSRL